MQDKSTCAKSLNRCMDYIEHVCTLINPHLTQAASGFDQVTKNRRRSQENNVSDDLEVWTEYNNNSNNSTLQKATKNKA